MEHALSQLGVLTQTGIIDVLQSSRIGRIGCARGEEVYVVPVTYVFKDFAAHCYSLGGQKIDWMRRNNKVCFEVERIRDHHNWECVIAQGLYEEITDARGRAEAMELFHGDALLQKSRLTNTAPTEPVQIHSRPAGEIIYFRINFLSLSGRFEEGL